MPRKVIGGLIQCSNPINDESQPVAKIQQAMFDKHVPLIEEAGKQGVQILCLQEIFNGPYFCPGQDKRWYDAAETVPGPTTEAVAKLAAKYRMAIVVPVYEKEMAGVLYNTAAVYRRRRHVPRQVPQEPHPADQRLLGEVLLQARQPRLPGLRDALRQGRRLHLLRPPLPGGRARARPERRRDRLQPERHGRRPLAVPVEARAAGARGRQRLLRRRDQPRRHRGALEHRQVLRLVATSSIRAADPRAGAARTTTSWSSPRSTST